jgi:hypothetical protein
VRISEKRSPGQIKQAIKQKKEMGFALREACSLALDRRDVPKSPKRLQSSFSALIVRLRRPSSISYEFSERWEPPLGKFFIRPGADGLLGL